jgi:prepilin-type processing-associated H-X9-DG protein
MSRPPRSRKYEPRIKRIGINLDRSRGFRNRSRPPKQMKRSGITLVKLFVIVAVIGIVVALLLPALRNSRHLAPRFVCLSNLHQIALALKNYEKDHHAFPPAYTTDANGKPLHSWRTLIVPYMEIQGLYDSIDLTKPWDDPANAKALKIGAEFYRCPSADTDEGLTTYLAVVTPNSCFRATEPRSLSDITDDPQATLTVIEVDAAHAVPWMAPVDADENLVLSLGGPDSKPPHNGTTNAAFADGHTTFLSAATSAAQRRALISITGNDDAEAKGKE